MRTDISQYTMYTISFQSMEIYVPIVHVKVKIYSGLASLATQATLLESNIDSTRDSPESGETSPTRSNKINCP